MMGLAPYIGRQDAHDVVYDACRVVNEKGGRLADVLNAMGHESGADEQRLLRVFLGRIRGQPAVATRDQHHFVFSGDVRHHLRDA